MPTNSSLGSFGGMLDDLKSRLGFEREDDRYEAEDSADYEDYDEYDEFSYDEYGDFDKEDSVGGFKPIHTYTSRYGHGDSSPNLVSIGDVKATTPLPSLHEDYAEEPRLEANVPVPEPMFSPSLDYSSSDGLRSLKVVRPSFYGDVKDVAKFVKSGYAVVLVMRYTPEELTKRILDFSFGVASALEASVECAGDKVYVIARGSALTDAEKLQLRAQSII